MEPRHEHRRSGQRLGRLGQDDPLLRGDGPHPRRRARDLGFPMEKVAELLALWQDRSRASADVKQLAEAQVAALETRIVEMQAMQATLRHLVHACAGDERPDCPILSDLGGT